VRRRGSILWLVLLGVSVTVAPLTFAGTIVAWGEDGYGLSDVPTGNNFVDMAADWLDNYIFVTTWDTFAGDGTTVTLALAGTVNATIDWGDDTITDVNTPGPHVHDYGSNGTCKSGLLYKSASKPPRKRKILIVQVKFGKILASKG